MALWAADLFDGTGQGAAHQLKDSKAQQELPNLPIKNGILALSWAIFFFSLLSAYLIIFVHFVRLLYCCGWKLLSLRLVAAVSCLSVLLEVCSGPGLGIAFIQLDICFAALEC